MCLDICISSPNRIQGKSSARAAGRRFIRLRAEADGRRGKYGDRVVPGDDVALRTPPRESRRLN